MRKNKVYAREFLISLKRAFRFAACEALSAFWREGMNFRSAAEFGGKDAIRLPLVRR